MPVWSNRVMGMPLRGRGPLSYMGHSEIYTNVSKLVRILQKKDMTIKDDSLNDERQYIASLFEV